jgi:hypothetical protein
MNLAFPVDPDIELGNLNRAGRFQEGSAVDLDLIYA